MNRGVARSQVRNIVCRSVGGEFIPYRTVPKVPKGFMGNGCLPLSDRISQCFSPQEEELDHVSYGGPRS